MLEDFPGPSNPAPAAPPPPVPAVSGQPFRKLWFLVPAALLAYDLFLAVWNMALRGLVGGGFGMAFAWLPWLLHTGLVLGVVGWSWSRRAWSPGVQGALIAAAALPLLRFGASQLLVFTGGYRAGGLGWLVTAFLGPFLGLGLALLVAILARGEVQEAKEPEAPGTLAAAGAAALSGGWFVWALLPLFSSLLGADLARRMVEPEPPREDASPRALQGAGWLALVSACAAVVVPLAGLLKFRGAMGTLLGTEGLALAAGAVTWNVLGMRWSRARRDGRGLRIAAWLVLALPALLVGLLVLLLLIFKPRLF